MIQFSVLFSIFACKSAVSTVSAWGPNNNSNSNARQKDPTRSMTASANEESRNLIKRATFLHGLLIAPSMAVAFDGGVGGLGKTKPITGVELFEKDSKPIQNEQGIVSAEIKSSNGKPIRIEFQTPWPLLPTTSGLEARDLRSSESAFVQVVPEPASWQSPKVFKQLLMDSVLASQGKFGAYGTPVDIKVKPLPGDERQDAFSVTFTSYTPAMRESERQLWIKSAVVDSTLILLIVGTTKTRFKSQENSFRQILDTFLAVPAPETKLRAR